MACPARYRYRGAMSSWFGFGNRGGDDPNDDNNDDNTNGANKGNQGGQGGQGGGENPNTPPNFGFGNFDFSGTPEELMKQLGEMFKQSEGGFQVFSFGADGDGAFPFGGAGGGSGAAPSPEQRAQAAENAAVEAASSMGKQLLDSGNVRPQDAAAVTEAIRLAELWLDEATVFPASSGPATAWTPRTWFENTLPTWKRFIGPIAVGMDGASQATVPPELSGLFGGIGVFLAKAAGQGVGRNMGQQITDLAKQTIAGCDFGLPLVTSVVGILPANLNRLTSQLDVPAQEALVFVSAREAARQRLFQHVPWLVELVVSAVEEYAAGLEYDNSTFEEALRDIDPASMEDMASMQDFARKISEQDLAPKIISKNPKALERLETILALIEGWVDHVVYTALKDRLPSADTMLTAWQVRRATGGSAETVFKNVFNVEMQTPNIKGAHNLWERVDAAVGLDARDAVWNHPDFLPVASDLESSASFIDGLLSSKDEQDFDPIAEISALEDMLKQQAEGSEDGSRTQDDEDDAAGNGDDDADGDADSAR